MSRDSTRPELYRTIAIIYLGTSGSCNGYLASQFNSIQLKSLPDHDHGGRRPRRLPMVAARPGRRRDPLVDIVNDNVVAY